MVEWCRSLAFMAGSDHTQNGHAKSVAVRSSDPVQAATDPDGSARMCPRQDSNLRSRLRRAVLYPLSYEGLLFRSSGHSFSRVMTRRQSIAGCMVVAHLPSISGHDNR